MSPRRVFKRENAMLIVAACVSLLAIVAIVVAVGLRAQDQNRIDELARSTNDALCDFKHNIENRVAITQQFYDDIRAGRRPPVPGISDSDLQRSIDTQRSALVSLSDLDCKEASP